MHARLFMLAALAAAMLTSACGGGGDNTTAAVAVYKELGSLQCTGGGTSVSALQTQLAVAGIEALAASCGLDGNVHPAVCGAPDGRIGIIDVRPAQAQLATTLGFAMLSTLPAPVRQACS